MSLRYLNVTQLSELTGKDERTIKKKIKGLNPHREDGRARYFDTFEALPMIYETWDALNKKLMQEQLRHETAKADKVRLDVDKRRGLLVEIEKIAETVGREYTAIRASFLALATKLAHELAIIDKPVEIKLNLEGAINEVLSELQADARYAQAQIAIVPQSEIQDDSGEPTSETDSSQAEGSQAASEDQPS